MKNKSLLFLFCAFFSGLINAQDDLLSELEEDAGDKGELILATFKSPYLINAQTNEQMKKGSLDFRITHRFGNMFSASGGGHTLFGLDQASNIRFSFDYGLTDKLQLGIGRSKLNEHIDGSIKYSILQQKTKGMPLSLSAFVQMAYTPKKDINKIYNLVTDRFSYAYQLVLTKKMNWISIGLLPTYVHRNLIVESTNVSNNSKETNDLFSAGFMARIRFSRRFALIAEYFYTFSDYRLNNTNNPYYMPLGIGFEIETGGHIFHVNFTNTSGIIYNDFIPNSSESWNSGAVKLGFNISRVFAL